VSTYDANGSTITRSGRSGNYTFGWDYENRMSGIGGAETDSYVYDDQGKRTSKTVGGAVSRYLYDGLNLVGQDGDSAENYLVGRRTDELLATERDGVVHFFATDVLGSAAIISSSSGTVENKYVFDAWGQLKAETRSVPNAFSFTGRETSETDQLLYRFRYYSPLIGRFTQEDRMGYAAGINLSAYVGNHPTEYTDPLGLAEIRKPGPCGGTLGAALSRLRGERDKGHTCKCEDYAKKRGRDFDTEVGSSGPPYIYVVEGNGWPAQDCGTNYGSDIYVYIKASCCQVPHSPCDVGSLLLHEMLHNWRHDKTKVEDPEGFKACTFGCFDPSRYH
jgi:RHS repeat-associated protein